MSAGDFFHVTAPPLVTLETAKRELKISLTDTTHDPDVQLRMKQATNIVLDYLQHGADPEWTPETVPDPVQQAVLIWVSHLYERGQTMPATVGGGLTGTATDAEVWQATDRLLKRFRDPAIA